MTRFVARRLLASLVVVVLSSFVAFVLVASSGSPLDSLPENTPREVVAQLRHELHLDRPIPVRYAIWAAAVAHGDLGTSARGQAVGPRLRRAFGSTVGLVVVALAVAMGATLLVGCVSATRPQSAFDHGATVFSFVALSMPVFWLAGVLKDLAIRFNHAVGLHVFPTVQERTPNLGGGLLATTADRASHLVLPVLALALLSMAEWSRYFRSSMLDELDADYVRTARAKGLAERAVTARHAVRNASVPLLTLVSLDFGRLLGGAVVVERVFAWSGMGQLLIDGIQESDTQLVSAWLLVGATAVVLVNLLGDLAHGWLDPRVRDG